MVTIVLLLVAAAVGFAVGLLVGRNNPGVANAAAVLANKARVDATAIVPKS